MNSPIFRRRHESRFIFISRRAWSATWPYLATIAFACLYALMFAKDAAS